MTTTWRTWFRVRNNNYWFRPIAICGHCTTPFVHESASKMKACAASACRQALRFEVIKRYESTEKSRERIKRYSTSVRGAAIRQRWANANPESLRASWEKANAKRKSQPEERECKTVLCANTFIVVGIAKAKRQFCDPCRKAHKGYQDTRRYWRKKRSRLRAA